MARAEAGGRRGTAAGTGDEADVDLIVDALVEAIVGPPVDAEPGAMLELEAHLARVQGRMPEPRPAPAAPLAEPPPAPAERVAVPSTPETDAVTAPTVMPLRPGAQRVRPGTGEALHPIEERIRRLDQSFRQAAAPRVPEPVAPALPESDVPSPPRAAPPPAPVRPAAPLPARTGSPGSPFSGIDEARFSPVTIHPADRDLVDDEPGLPPSRRLARIVFAAGLVVLAFMSVPVIVRLLAAQASVASVVAEDPGAAAPGQ